MPVLNTIDTDLFNSVISSRFATTAKTVFAPLDVYSTKFSEQFVTPKSSINVPIISAMGATKVDATDFSPVATTLDNINVPLKIYSLPFGLSSLDYNKGIALEGFVDDALDAFANDIYANSLESLMVTSNFDTVDIGADSADFDSADMKVVWSDFSGKGKSVLLATEYYGNLNPSNTQDFGNLQGAKRFGFDGGVFEQYFGVAGATDLKGFACTNKAIAVGSALPKHYFSNTLMQEVYTVEGIGLPVMVTVYVSENRELLMSFDVAFGASVADSASGRILIGR